MKTWITSDTHFYHKRIIEYEGRPFSDAQEMTKEMIKRWNKTVKKDDLVYHLGDVYMNASREEIQKALESLNGEIVLVSGNHDRDNYNFFKKIDRFKTIIPYRQCLMLEKFIILSHEPLYLESRSPFINLYGHVHGDSRYKTISPSGICCCVERWDYRPVELDYLKEKIQEERDW